MDKKKIRFIDPHYKNLFFIEDGDSVKVTFQNGDQKTLKCEYLDECHTQLGNTCYHICQLAELAEKNGFTIEPAENHENNIDFSHEECEEDENEAEM